MFKRIKSVTLIELIIVMFLLLVVILGVNSIDNFSRFHLTTSDNRAKLQNEVSFIIEHMNKNLNKSVGDVNNPAFTYLPIAGDNAIEVLQDSNGNNKADPGAGDNRVGYAWKNDDNSHSFLYYSDASVSPPEVLSRGHIMGNFITKEPPAVLEFTVPAQTEVLYNPANNYFHVQIVACWDPAQSQALCGTPDNPQVAMKATIRMPYVSTN